MKVAVLKGGIGSEREVSLVSGGAVAEALRGEGFDVTEVDAHPARLEAALRRIAPDAVFNALHGDWGEDGQVQRILDGLRLPYSHSGAEASALAMDKLATRDALTAVGIRFAESRETARAEIARGGAMDPPYVVKPNGQGSSASVHLVMAETPGALAAIAADEGLGPHPMVERYVPGRELTVACMDGRALMVTEIIPEGWYSYEEKYGDNAARHELPANLPEAVTAECLRVAELAHRTLGCRGLTRTDFRYDDSELGVDNASRTELANRVVTLELNTQPGMTPNSLAPEQAAALGMGFGELCRWIVEDASWPRGTQHT